MRFKSGYEGIRASDWNEIVREINKLNNITVRSGSKTSIRKDSNGISLIVAGGGGGSSSDVEYLYVKIIEGLSYDTDTETGRSRYWARLTSNLADDWPKDSAGTDYALNEKVTGNDNKLYICVVSEGSGSQDPVDDPASGEVECWEVVSDDEILIYHDYDTSADMRDYSPWLKQDYIYPVRRIVGETSTALYLEQQFTYIGAPGARSIGIQESTGRMYACIGDTII